MPDQNRLAFHMLLTSDDPYADESDAFDAQLEQQLAHLEHLSSSGVDALDSADDDWDAGESLDRALRAPFGRFS